MKKIFFIIILFSSLYCSKEPLKLTKVEACEFFDSTGKCKKFLTEKYLYEIQVSKNFRMQNWENLSNYLYFESKNTPGFVLHFNRKFTFTEKKKILETYKAYYQFKEISGRVEGFEIGDDWIGSFQYLGSILKERQRAKKEEKNYPFLYTVFPAHLKFLYTSDYFSGEIDLEFDLKILPYVENSTQQ
jgi:hypothetical protein